MKPYLKLHPYKDAKGLQQIQLYYSNKHRILQIDTKIRTKQIYWNKDKQEITSRVTDIGQDPQKLNKELGKKLNKIIGIVLDYNGKYKDIDPDIDYVKTEYFKEKVEIIAEHKKEVKQLMSDWIKDQKEGKVKYTKIFNTIVNDLDKFHPEPLYYPELTTKFFDKLRHYWLHLEPPIQNSC